MSRNKEVHNGYQLSRAWFDFALMNPDKVSGNHTALYMWLIELNNRLSWVDKFGITVREGMDGMSCKSRTTYQKCFNNLVDWGFVEIVKASKNQYQCNIIALPKNEQAFVQPHVQAQVKHLYSHVDSTCTGTGTIPQTNKPLNEKTLKQQASPFDVALNNFLLMRKKIKKPPTDRAMELLHSKLDTLSEGDVALKIKILDQSTLNNWQDVYQLKTAPETQKQAKMNGNAVVFPEYYDRKFEATLEMNQLARYHGFLRNKGWIPVKANEGYIANWVKQKQPAGSLVQNSIGKERI